MKTATKKQASTGRVIAIREPQLPAAPKSMLQVIAEASRDPKVDVVKLRELLTMRREELSRMAEIEFNTALRQTQLEMPRVVKNAEGDKKIKYATLEAVSKAINPHISKNGFGLSYGMADSKLPNHYRITAQLSHTGGHSREYFIDLAVDDVGPKGERNKTAVQGAGSTVSYGRRYLKLMIFDVAVVGEDNDGNNSAQPISKDQLTELLELADKAGVDKPGFCNFMAVPSFAEIPAKRYPEAKIALRSYKAGKKAAAVA